MIGLMLGAATFAVTMIAAVVVSNVSGSEPAAAAAPTMAALPTPVAR